jgi:hypothetical protein
MRYLLHCFIVIGFLVIILVTSGFEQWQPPSPRVVSLYSHSYYWLLCAECVLICHRAKTQRNYLVCSSLRSLDPSVSVDQT